jgi:Ca2+-binding RTX toxin-like protein
MKLSGQLTDASALDTHRVLVTWGDGSAQEMVSIDQATKKFAGGHRYLIGGIFKIAVTAIDNDGAASNEQLVTAYVEGMGVVNRVLYVIGTNSRDNVDIELGGSKTAKRLNVVAQSNGVAASRSSPRRGSFDLAGVDGIVMHLLDGEDRVELDRDVTVSAEIHGGDGDDRIQGGSGADLLFGEAGSDELHGERGADVLVGGDGDDRLFAGRGESYEGRDILIGGRGSDNIQGEGGDDLLIAGFTTFDDNVQSLQSILREWASPRDFAARVVNIRKGTGEFLQSPSVALKSSGTGRTVFDDGAKDKLSGDAGRDWFFANLNGNDRNSDNLTDWKKDELIDRLLN